jgi:HK97 family phage major capsid protein
MKTIEEIETRMAEIKVDLENPEADLDALQEEVRSLSAERDELRKSAKEAEEKRVAIANGLGEVKEKTEEKKSMTVDEIRNSKAYIDAYAEYIKSGDDRECRAIMKSENANSGGQLPVPVLVDNTVRTAWENDQILSRITKTYFKGNLKVTFERAGDVAYEHAEGTSAPTEESLTLGIVTLIPKNVKKWINREAA